ncbi:MAG: Cell division protein FtsL [Hyphomicrobiaceae bacterium hypho_1]
MARFLTVGSFFIALASAFIFYTINHQTRIIINEVAYKQRLRDDLVIQIVSLKAKRAFLASADRIAAAAKALGMQPVSGDQLKFMYPVTINKAAKNYQVER